MFRVQQKLKKCKIRFIKWRKSNKCNVRVEIVRLQKEMEAIQLQGGKRLEQMKTIAVSSQ